MGNSFGEHSNLEESCHAERSEASKKLEVKRDYSLRQMLRITLRLE